MIELLPIFLWVLCGLSLRRLAFGEADYTWSWHTVQLCSSGTYAELAIRIYRLRDSLRQLCGVRLIASGVVRFRHSRKARSRTSL
jgi:hypothetical protein